MSEFTKVDVAFLEHLAETIGDESPAIINNKWPLVEGLKDIAERVSEAVPIKPSPIVASSRTG